MSKVLVMDVGGTNVKVLATGQKDRRRFSSGPRMTPRWRKKWQRHLEDHVARLIFAFQLDDVVIGGGNVRKLTKLPKGCRAGDSANAFVGGFRLWEDPAATGPLRTRKA